MPTQINIEGLSGPKLGEAWTLARSSGAYANEDWWIAEGGDLIARGGGVLAARAADGRLHGLATFEAPAPGASTLLVRMLVTFELTRSAPARSALLASLKRIATKLECTHVVLPLCAQFAAVA